MRQRRHRHRLDVVRRHEIAAAERRRGAGQPQQSEAAARRGAECNPLIFASRAREIDDVFLDRDIDMHVFERCLHRQQISARRDLLDMRLFGATGAAARQDLAFLLAPGIADGDAHQETVKLRFG